MRVWSGVRLPARYGVVAWAAGLFLAVNTIVRIGLLIWERGEPGLLPWRLFAVLAVGLLYDLAALSYVLVPFALLALALPDRAWGRKAHAVLASALLLALVFLLLFTSVAEALFWNEFTARFNFIAVDYLIYTREALGNIRESYPVGPLLGAVAAATLAIGWLIRRPVMRVAGAEGGSLSRRLLATVLFLLLPVLAFRAVGDKPREALSDAVARELAGDGYYEFGRAFRSNDLDFNRFYRTVDSQAAAREMRDEFDEAHSTAVFTGGAHPLERLIPTIGPARPYNVVLITIESLGSDFVESFGGRKGLTPNFDRLAREGLSFTHMYATGTRTVRGLEALSLSLPPTPGHAVLTRKNNKGFQTLGGVFKSQGYEPLFIYGGYSYFDNMQDFFGGNGYTVIDRTSIASADISHETIWGVADEDLFKLVLQQIDTRAEAGKKVFAHVMTTSNHRPFTYPDGRVDIKSGSGREGAVKYTDWAIGKFMREASKRPWFKDTLFAFIADHTSHARGRTDLPPENYRIPLIIYAPSLIAPRVIESVASQMDVGPTILALLNISYTSRFFGQDILTEGAFHPRALFANYVTVGHMEKGIEVELSPKRRVRVREAASGRELPARDPKYAASIFEAIAYYQIASDVVRGRR